MNWLKRSTARIIVFIELLRQKVDVAAGLA